MAISAGRNSAANKHPNHKSRDNYELSAHTKRARLNEQPQVESTSQQPVASLAEQFSSTNSSLTERSLQ